MRQFQREVTFGFLGCLIAGGNLCGVEAQLAKTRWKECSTIEKWPAFAFASFSPDGKMLASNAEEPAKVFLWDAGTGNKVRAIEREGTIALLEFAPDGKTLACAAGGFVDIRDVATGKRLTSLGKFEAFRGVQDLRFSPNGKTLALSVLRTFDPIPQGSELIIWDIAAGKVITQLDIRGESRNNFASYVLPKISPDFKTVLTYGHVDGTVRFWDLATKKPLSVLRAKLLVPGTVLWSPNGQMVALEGTLNSVPLQVWDIKSGKLKKSFRPPAAIAGWTWSPDSTRLAVACKNDILLWDWSTGDAHSIIGLPKNFETVRPVLFANNGLRIAAAAHSANMEGVVETGSLRIWETDQASALSPPPPSSSEKER